MPDRNTGFPVNSTSITQPYWRPTQRTRSQIIGTTWNYVPKFLHVNEARFGFSRYNAGFAPGDCPGSGAGQPDATVRPGKSRHDQLWIHELSLTGSRAPIPELRQLPKFRAGMSA